MANGCDFSEGVEREKVEQTDLIGVNRGCG